MSTLVKQSIRKAVMGGLVQVANVNRKFLKEPESGHPDLTGLHKPMTDEFDLSELTVTGEIPAGLDGR